MDERAIVRLMRHGDEAAFEAFFALYFPRLFRFALRRVADNDTAQDIVQATLVAAVTKLSTWRGEAALFTWLCTICRHEISAHYRRRLRGAVIESIDDNPEIRARLEVLASDADAPERALERRELAELVQVTLDYLPGHYGDVLEWKYINGLSVVEIAARLESTPKAVESLLTRAREAFREGFGSLAEGRS